jgi:hypothetical protein
MKPKQLQALTMEKYLTFLCSLHILKNVQVMYLTNTMRNANNKLCMQIINLKLLTYKSHTTKKNPNTYMFTKHIQTQ